METFVRPPAPPETPTAGPSENVETSDKRKRQPRNSACQPCAALKMKCVASADGGKCERCNRMGRECVQAIPKPRKRKTEDVGFQSPGGVPLPNFAESDTPSGPSTADLQRPTKNVRTAFETTNPKDPLMLRPDIHHNSSKSFATLFAQGLSLSELPPGIDYAYVQNKFTVFRQFTPHFPFVGNLIGADAVTMIAQRPFTTAAVCTVTTATDTGMQTQLSGMFRFALTTKALVEGERNIDLMIGLLIFLAWHHHYISKPQVYQYLCLLAGMAADLGLYHQTPRTNIEDVALVIERNRAFLGCYYICCGLSSKGFNEPNPLRWTDNLRRCAEDVAKNGNVPSDQSLISLIELAHSLEDLENALLHVDLKRSTTGYSTEMHAKSAIHRLKSLKREYPYLGGQTAFSAAMIYVQNKSLVGSDSRDISALIQCACAIKEYLDEVLSRPSIILHHMSIVDWTNLLEIIVLLAKMAQPLPNNAGWEAGALTSMLQPAALLDALCAHMASAPHANPLAPRHEPSLQALRSLCEYIKRNIVDGDVSVTELPLPSNANTVNGGHGSSILQEGVLNTFMRGP